MQTTSLCSPRVEVGYLSRYLEYVQRAPMLSAEDELRLARLYREHHDIEAAEGLLVPHLRLVVRIARDYRGYELEFADLIQEGTFGLMRAMERFDPDRGVRFASFAVHFIRAYVQEFALRNCRIVRPATTKAQRKLFFKLRGHKTRLERLRRSDVERIARVLEVSPEEVETMETRLQVRDMDIDLLAVTGSLSDDEGLTYTATETRAEPSAECEAFEEQAMRSRALELGLDGLDPRSRDVIHRRWLQDDKATLAELGRQYGISKERVRQIEAKALAHLRNCAAASGPHRDASLPPMAKPALPAVTGSVPAIRTA